jgi:hypothetical protein
MPLLPAGFLAASLPKALGLGFDRVAGGRLARVAAVFGQPIFEFLDPRRKRGDRLPLASQLLLVVGELLEQALDEIDDGIRACWYTAKLVSRGIMMVGESYAVPRHLRNPCRCILSCQAE